MYSSTAVQLCTHSLIRVEPFFKKIYHQSAKAEPQGAKGKAVYNHVYNGPKLDTTNTVQNPSARLPERAGPVGESF